MLSLPRDLYVDLAGGGKGRINTALALGGPERLIETIKQDFDIPINHYAMVDFHGFESLVSAVDGVPVYFQLPVAGRGDGPVPVRPWLRHPRRRAGPRLRPVPPLRDPAHAGRAVGGGPRAVTSVASPASSSSSRLRSARRWPRACATRSSSRTCSASPRRTSPSTPSGRSRTSSTSGSQFKDFDPDQLVTYTPSPTSGAWVGAMSVLFLDEAAVASPSSTSFVVSHRSRPW